MLFLYVGLHAKACKTTVCTRLSCVFRFLFWWACAALGFEAFMGISNGLGFKGLGFRV